MRLTPGKSLALLMCWWVLSWILGSLIISNLSGHVRIAVIVQNIIMFILPAFMTALLVSAHPLSFIGLSSRPKLAIFFYGIITVVASIPLLNWVVALNESIRLPESMANIESALRAFEEMAQQMVLSIIGTPTMTSLIVSVLLIGVLTGIGEEVFFRGAMQTIFLRIFSNSHIAIWITAAIFSAMHFEFFGFIPRLLLGALLGYMAFWCGSLWLPIIAHALNNSLVVICMWIELRTGETVALSSIGEGFGMWDTAGKAISAFAVCMLLKKLYALRI